jgi:hypothetical protein
VHACMHVRACACMQHVLHMYKVWCVRARACTVSVTIKITYCSYFTVYRTVTLPTVLLVFVYVKLLSLNERITQMNGV